jgi:hypothetical protein
MTSSTLRDIMQNGSSEKSTGDGASGLKPLMISPRIKKVNRIRQPLHLQSWSPTAYYEPRRGSRVLVTHSPYHTFKPSQRELIVARIQLYYNTCTDDICTCHLQQYLTEDTTIPQKSTVKPKAKTQKGRKRRAFNKRETSPSSDYSPPLVIAMPNLTNKVYDEMTIVKPANDLAGAGLCLYIPQLSLEFMRTL